MRSRAATWLAWSLAGLCLAMAVATTVLSVLPRPASEGAGVSISVGEVLISVSFLAFPVVGALTASRRPRNPIGWLCLAVGLFWWFIIVSEDYSAYGLAVSDSVPFPVTIYALLYAWVWVPAVGLLGIFMILLFPDGQLPSRRWRPLAWLSGAVIVVESVVVLLKPGPLDGLGGARNPLGLEAFPWLAVLDLIVLPLLPLCMLASAGSLVLRFRRSTGEERQQIKWFAYAAAATVGGLILAYMIPNSVDTPPWFERAGYALVIATTPAIPVSIGIAILRYRLYDIDRIINRTLVYGTLTVMLGATYFGSVVVLQQVFRTVSGQQSTVAVVTSTLAIAALFNPLLRRVQSFVDRRFYRSKYDAAKTLEAFSAKMRDDTDLNTLSSDILAVVRETMQPEHVSLWLRDQSEKR